MLRFRFRQLATLPRLAWCAQLLRGSNEVVVEHGPWVETQEPFFAEGAWDDAFDGGGLERATLLLGSGAYLQGDQAVFCTTTHTMERLQSVRVDDRLFISNSFVYLLAATEDALDVNYRFYERDFMTFLRGRRDARRTIPTLKNRQVQLHYGEKIRIDGDLAVQVEKFPDGPAFTNYDGYIASVDSIVARLHRNAAAAERRQRFEPLSTLSTGYDSPACTVFAKKIGCRRAITLLEARRDYNPYAQTPKELSDSGAEIAAHLQVELDAFRRDAYLARDDYPEAEFLATGNGGDDVVMSAAEPMLTGTMLFTGFLGDTLWGLTASDPHGSRDYRYVFPAGGTFGEFRLRVGFIHVPIPLLTYPRRAEILEISRSPEMAPWRLDNDYDRPIPRRLVESSGVPRAIYATEKKAVTQPFWLPTDIERIRAMMSPRSYESLVSYGRSPAVRSQLSRTARIKEILAPRLAPLVTVLQWYNSKFKRTFGFRLFPQFRVDQFRTSVLFGTPAGLKFHWAVDKVSPRYRATGYTDSKRNGHGVRHSNQRRTADV